MFRAFAMQLEASIRKSVCSSLFGNADCATTPKAVTHFLQLWKDPDLVGTQLEYLQTCATYQEAGLGSYLDTVYDHEYQFCYAESETDVWGGKKESATIKEVCEHVNCDLDCFTARLRMLAARSVEAPAYFGESCLWNPMETGVSQSAGGTSDRS